MATSINLQSGSLLCGNPIYVSVVAESIGGNATFHKVIVEVVATLQGLADSEMQTFLLSSPTNDAETICIDISSALRSVAQSYEYAPLTANYTYPHIAYTLRAWEEYMVEGTLHEKVGIISYPGTLKALLGAFTDIERFVGGVTKSIQRFSRKPPIGEICSDSDTLFYPTPLDTPATLQSGIENGPTVIAYSLTGLSGTVTKQGHTIHVVPAENHRHEFQFVNGMGIVESVSVYSMEAYTTEKEREHLAITSPGAFNKFTRYASRIIKDRKSIKLSSGPVNRDWEEWFIHEFFNSTTVWIKKDGVWLPCTIDHEDTIDGTDASQNVITTLLFTVKLNISGTWHNRL